MANSSNRRYLCKVLKNKIPSAITYYSELFPALKALKHTNWVSVRCCFHEDQHPSLRINLITGAFRCFACRIRGGNIIAFHMQRYQQNFIQTIDYFGAWSEA